MGRAARTPGSAAWAAAEDQTQKPKKLYDCLGVEAQRFVHLTRACEWSDQIDLV